MEEKKFYNELKDFFADSEININNLILDVIVDENNIINIHGLLNKWQKHGICLIKKDFNNDIESFILI